MVDILGKCGQLYQQAQRIACSHGAELLLIRNACEGDFARLSKVLTGDGYSYYSTGKEGDVLFAAYIRDTEIVSLSYTPFEQSLRLIRDTKSLFFPAKEEISAEPVVAPLVTQVRLGYFAYDCGMVYIVRLGDGRFFMIDAGMGEAGEVEHILALLQEQNVLPGKPRIASWFFSHAHVDHFNGFVKMMKKYGDEIIVESLIYNWAMKEKAGDFSFLGEFEEVVEGMFANKVMVCHTGQRLRYRDVEFDVLYAPEDLYPDRFKSLNNSSVVLRMTACNKRVMWLGDATGQCADYLCRKYPKETFASEILQVAHHGYWGASNELYRLIDPEVLLWPCPGYRYTDVPHWDCNRYLSTSEKVKVSFCGGVEETVLNMAEPVVWKERYADKHMRNDTVYKEDFTVVRNPYELQWSCIVGGTTGYAAVELEMNESSGCEITAGERLGVLEMVRPQLMNGIDDYVFTMKGNVVAGYGRVGLIWNYQNPTVWDENAVWWIPVKEGPLEISLVADTYKQKAQLYDKHVQVDECAYIPVQHHGIFLVLQGGRITLSEVCVAVNGQ